MGKIKIGINGFGRIGKLVFRESLNRKDIEVIAINDPFLDLETLAYLIKYDSVHGNLDLDINVDKLNNLVKVGRDKIYFSQKQKPEEIKWGNHSIDYVVESSGVFNDYEKAKSHLLAGAKKIIISAPAKNVPMFVMGVNHKDYDKSMDIISNASCTTNCLAPLAKVINDEFGIKEGLMTTIHSQTASQNVVDGVNLKKPRLGRSGNENIIPSTTGAAKAVGKVIPELEGKLTGMSFRIPTTNVSVVDLTIKLNKNTTYEEIVEKIKQYSTNQLKGVLGYTDNFVVSKDFVGDSRTSIFDIKAGMMLNQNFVKLVAWYDNEWAYSCKILDLINYIDSK